MAIDIGSPAVGRGSTLAATYTLILKENPANESGTITTIEIYARTNITGCIVGTFYLTNGTTLKCRANVAIGNVDAGEKRVFTPVSLAVVAGDFIGIYFDTGTIERDTSGYAGLWYIDEEHIDPNDEANYSSMPGDTLSLWGESAVAVVGRSFGFIMG